MPLPAQPNRPSPRAAIEATAPSVELDMHVLNLGEDHWALHGLLAYEGEVIAATYASEAEAWIALTGCDVRRSSTPSGVAVSVSSYDRRPR